MFTRKSVKVTEKVNKPAPFITALLLAFILMSQVGLDRSQASIVATDFSVAIASEPASLDAPDATTSADFQVVSQIYDTLIRYEPGGSRPVPGLAQSWTNSSDGLTWTFTLQSGVTFHDGTTLDSAAVLFNFQRWWDSAHPQHEGTFEVFNFLFGTKNDPSSPDLIASLSNPTATQFVITLKRPAAILTFLAYPALGIGSPTAIQAGTINSQPVGSGPFKFNAWVSGDHITLDRYPGYWGSKAVASSLTFKVLGTAASQLAALQSNSVQSAGDISGGQPDRCHS